jgi:retron-type reverse transcriptase
MRLRSSDRRVLKLILLWLEAGVLEEGEVRSPATGTPQGGVISPLLANIYLGVLDMYWTERYASLGKLFRYADDFHRLPNEKGSGKVPQQGHPWLAELLPHREQHHETAGSGPL